MNAFGQPAEPGAGAPRASLGSVLGRILLHGAFLARFAVMGAAQALMHQNHLPEVAQFAGGNLSSPANARRAVVALSDILAKAQALGQTGLDTDPVFQSALSQVSTRFGANLGLDAVDLALGKLAANPATAGAVPALREELASARSTFARAGSR